MQYSLDSWLWDTNRHVGIHRDITETEHVLWQFFWNEIKAIRRLRTPKLLTTGNNVTFNPFSRGLIMGAKRNTHFWTPNFHSIKNLQSKSSLLHQKKKPTEAQPVVVDLHLSHWSLTECKQAKGWLTLPRRDGVHRTQGALHVEV